MQKSRMWDSFFFIIVLKRHRYDDNENENEKEGKFYACKCVWGRTGKICVIVGDSFKLFKNIWDFDT